MIGKEATTRGRLLLAGNSFLAILPREIPGPRPEPVEKECLPGDGGTLKRKYLEILVL